MSVLSRIPSYNGNIDLINLVIPKSPGGVSKAAELFNTVLPLIALHPNISKLDGWDDFNGWSGKALMYVPLVNLIHLGALSICERSLWERVSSLVGNVFFVVFGFGFSVFGRTHPIFSLILNAGGNIWTLASKMPRSVQQLSSLEGASTVLKLSGTTCYIADFVLTLIQKSNKLAESAPLLFEGLYQGAQLGAQGLKLYHQTKSLDYQTCQLALDVGVKAILSFVRLYQAYRICYSPKPVAVRN